MSLAFVFPGQGSQSVGMLADLGATEPVVRQTFDEASAVLGYDLWALCQQGPESDLGATERTQPAMLAAGVATWRVWMAKNGARPVAMAGHSLGEYTALVAAEAISLEDALPLVRQRAQYMQQAVPEGLGAMAAILGLDDDGVRAACEEAARGEAVQAVNFNAPGQVVIAGHATAVARAIDACKARGAKRAMPLPVSAPFHSSLMQPAALRLQETLARVEIRAPKIPLINNVDVAEQTDPARIREALVRQAAAAVRWVEIVRRMAQHGATQVIECGPGKVLAGLVKRIDGNLRGSALADRASLEQALAAIKGS